jgi:glycosyltransferase involved in cell wall biosynthesis
MLVTNPCTNDARVLKEARSLAENGYDVTIHAIAKDGIANFEKRDGFKIKRLNRIFRENTIAGKIEFTIRSVPLLIQENADVYHAHDLSTLLECYIASRIKRSKLVYDSHELYIRSYGNKSFGEKVYSYLENKLIKKADGIITVNPMIGERLRKQYKLINAPTIIMNCPYLKIGMEYNIDDRSIRQFRAKYSYLILFQGVIRKGLGLENLIKSMKYLDDEYGLLILGDGPVYKELRDLTDHLNLNHRIYFAGMIELRKLPIYTKIADLGVIYPDNSNLSHYYMSPNKLFEYIHGNLPVIVSDFPFNREVIVRYNVGILTNEISPKDFAHEIALICENRTKYNILKQNTEMAKKELNWESEEKKLLNLYSNLLS